MALEALWLARQAAGRPLVAADTFMETMKEYGYEDLVSPHSASRSGGDSMSSRLARQRQQRSMLRTAAFPVEVGEIAAASTAVVSELKILQTEVANSGRMISSLTAQLRKSDAEIEAMGQNTERMAAELRLLRAQQADLTNVQAAPASRTPTAIGPMVVNVSIDDDDVLTVSIT